MNEKMALELNSYVEKKQWQRPDIFCLDLKKTEGGGLIGTTEEDGAYHPESQM